MSRLVAVEGRYRLSLKAEHTRYRNMAGDLVPGVTTCLKELSKDALIEWAARVEREGFVYLLNAYDHASQILNLIPDAYFYATQRDTAADLGTIIHARIHASLNGTLLDPDGIPPELYEKSVHGWLRFDNEWKNRRMYLLASELQMVSEAHQVGGTLDILARDGDGALHLWDIKSSRAHPRWPWPEVIAQISEYAAIWEELNPLSVIQGLHAVRVGKDEADDLQTYTLTPEDRAAGLELFAAALAARNAKRRMKR